MGRDESSEDKYKNVNGQSEGRGYADAGSSQTSMVWGKKLMVDVPPLLTGQEGS